MKNNTPNTGSNIQARSDYKNTPSDQFKYWEEELGASHKRNKKWQKRGDRIIRRYTGGASNQEDVNASSEGMQARLNLFHSNTATLQSMLYGNTPKVDVSRRNLDANDDIGRVAADMMDRLLANDLATNGKEYDSVLQAVLEDRLLPGLGCARVRYEVETQEVPQPQPDGSVAMVQQMVREDSPIDYYHWRDVAWGWGRTFATIPWIAFRSYLDKDELEKRFGVNVATAAQLETQHVNNKEDTAHEPDLDSAWSKAEVWEIWDKKKRQVVWVVKGYDKVADTKDDPLQLSGFYPCPPFFLANPTTSLYIPTADFTLAQDLYNEIDVLHTRISIITEAVKVVGVYDAAAEGVKRMLKEGVENDLIPVDNWALFAERGGIQGSVVWMPLADIVNALDKLRDLRGETIGLLQQVTGMSDIMRGELGGQYEGVGQSQLKAKFGSVRVQALQDTFAKFATDLMQLKAEIIARHYDPKTIYQQSNVQNTFNAELAQQAIQLIKQPEQARLRVAVRAESIAMVDYAMLKQERTEFLTALSTYMQSAGTLMQDDPSAKPFLLQMLQWGMAGFKGSAEIEGVIDKAIEASQEEAEKAKEQPDPEQQKMQQMQQMEQMKLQGEMQKIQAKQQADSQTRQEDMQADIATARAQSQAKLMEIEAALQAKLAEISAKGEVDIQVEQLQSRANAEQAAIGTQNEMFKSAQEFEMEMAQKAAEHQMKLNEIGKQAEKKDEGRDNAE
jgi:hypothetical protein